MPSIRLIAACAPALASLLFQAGVLAVELEGEAVQGGLMFGTASPGSTVTLDGSPVMVSAGGRFVIGFGRDETGVRVLAVHEPSGSEETLSLSVSPREFDIERIDGLPPRTVTPDPEALERIRAEQALVANARARRDGRTDYDKGFAWPAAGRISGVYGSQRILNGKPKRPHYGVDIAAPAGTPVKAPAGGIVTMAHNDMFYSGGTLIVDHGHGVSTVYMHLQKILVKEGQPVTINWDLRPPDPAEAGLSLEERLRRIVDGLDKRGAWVEEGTLRRKDAKQVSAVIRSQTFIDNVKELCALIGRAR